MSETFTPRVDDQPTDEEILDALSGEFNINEELPIGPEAGDRRVAAMVASGLAAAKARRRGERSSHPEITDTLGLLLSEADEYDLLSADEEIELAKRIERGDLAAKDRLIQSNVRLVVYIAKKYQNHGLPLTDLVQEGMIGLIRAAELFDRRKGFRFSTYATIWIRQAIQRGLANTGREIRIPTLY